MAIKDRDHPEESWRTKRVTLAAAEDALRQAMERIDPKQNAFGHLFCTALIGMCSELHGMRLAMDMTAKRLSLVTRELKVDDDWKHFQDRGIRE
jgi:hypothetical protein